METNIAKMKVVYTVVERSPGRSYWIRVGVGFVNNDGSINLKLDATPVNGNLQIRDYEARDADRRTGPTEVAPKHDEEASRGAA